MPFLPGLAVVFLGISAPSGGDAGQVSKQVQALLHEKQVDAKPIPAAVLRTLAHHGEGSRDLVRNLHVDGAIGGELLVADGHLTLRLVIYDADGGLRSLSEIPLTKRSLTKDEIGVLRSNLEDDVSALVAAAPAAAPAVVAVPPPPPPASHHADVDLDADDSPLAPTKPTRAPVRARANGGELEFAPESARPVPAPLATKPAAKPVAKPVEVADADATDSVSPEELEAMTQVVAGVQDVASPALGDDNLHLGATVGLGIAGRSFSGPATLPGYASTAVGAVQFAAHVQPTERLTLGVLAERTLQMTTPLADGMAATTMSRWEIAGSFAIHRGSLVLAPQIGVGHRSFSIDSNDPARSPDGDYSYLIAGAVASSALGHHVTLRGNLAFEPVVSGAEPTAALFGQATRWAVDVGAAVELRPWGHMFARAAVDYQRFTWSWDMAGSRGAGGAVDGYPSGTLSLGADY